MVYRETPQISSFYHRNCADTARTYKKKKRKKKSV